MEYNGLSNPIDCSNGNATTNAGQNQHNCSNFCLFPCLFLSFDENSHRAAAEKTPAVSEKQNLVETGVIGLLLLTNDFLADPLRHGLPKQD